MKTTTVLLFAAIINGNTVPVSDDDGISAFPNYRACVLYAIRRAPEVGQLIYDAMPGFDGVILWRCAK